MVRNDGNTQAAKTIQVPLMQQRSVRKPVASLYLNAEDHSSSRGNFLARIAIYIILISSSGAFQIFIPSDNQSFFTLMPLVVASWIMILDLIRPKPQSSIKWLHPIPLLFLTCMPILSSFWSPNTTKTINVVVVLILFSTLAMAICRELTLEQRIRAASSILIILLILSALTAIFFPSLGIDVDNRSVAWRGIFQNKNSFGRVAAVQFLFSILLYTSAHGWKRLAWFTVAAMCLWAMIKAGSQTALVSALFAGVVTYVSAIYKCQYRKGRVISLILVGMYFLVSIAISAIAPTLAKYLSRDPTLTGRTTLWSLSEQFASERLYFGWGFGTVWQTEGGIGNWISSDLTFISGSAHNGLLDIRLQIGYVGLALTLFAFYYIISKALMGTDSVVYRSWIIGFVILYFIMDLTESTVFFGFMWFLIWIMCSPDSRMLRGKF